MKKYIENFYPPCSMLYNGLFGKPVKKTDRNIKNETTCDLFG